MLISMAIMVGVTGVIFSLVDPSHGTYRTQPEVSDLQQRLRVGTNALRERSGDGGCRLAGGRTADGLVDATTSRRSSHIAWA